MSNLIKQVHIGIFELDTEEESVLTLCSIFKHCGYKVSLFVSRKIWNIIKDYIDKNDITGLMVFDDNECFIDLYDRLKESIDNEKIDLLVIPRFRSVGYAETKKYIEFFGKYKAIVHVASYDRWLSMIPPLKLSYIRKMFGLINSHSATISVSEAKLAMNGVNLDSALGSLWRSIRGRMKNGIRLLQRSSVFDWFYCHLVFKHIPVYSIGEIHRDSDNPLKKIIQKKTGKRVIDLPFKLMEAVYNPDTDYDFPVFIVPGAVERKRRDYFSVLRFFSNPRLAQYKWKLVLLGRPVDNYGLKVLEMADKINVLMGDNRVEYIREYISKSEYDRFMKMGTHILAPIRKAEYQAGKDSGALYDVFKYNKIGIIDDAYFYDDSPIEKKTLITFKSKKDLDSLLFDIITKRYSYGHMKNYFQELSSYLDKGKYVEYVRTSVDSLLGSWSKPRDVQGGWHRSLGNTGNPKNLM